MKPMEIEKKSFEIIAEELAQRYPGQKADPEYDLLIRRVIHTTADFEYFETLSFSQHAVEKAKAAITKGCDIITDTTMAMSGINKKTLAQFGGQVHCF
ncbi:MAG: precorrin-8X methylmutase, partial [Firmicutes bacterium]|nr:precorrin-8X methylmutase [Bacillota bacterium]